MNRLEAKMWRALNKRPPKPRDIYGQVAAMWAMIGVLGFMGIATSIGYVDAMSEGAPSWVLLLPIALILGTVWLGYTVVRQHKREGLYTAIADAGTKHWLVRMKELGK